jgi:dCTP deaminase
MTTLCDLDIRDSLDMGEIDITPRPLGNLIQPASVDLKLASDFLIPKPEQVISFRDGARPKPVYDEVKGSVWMAPGDFVLGRTFEIIKIGKRLEGKIEGKSTLGRCGLMVHVTAGYLDPGFNGTVTLELYNVAPYAIEVVEGMLICQLRISKLTRAPERPYGTPGLGSHYQNQRETTAPR